MAIKAGTVTLPRSVTFLASLGSFALVGALLYWAQAILIPIVLAVLVTFLLSPLVIRLQRWGLPKIAAVPLVVLFAFAAVGGVGWAVEMQVERLVKVLPREHGPKIRANVTKLLNYIPEPAKGHYLSVWTLEGLVSQIRQDIEQKTAPDKEKVVPVRIETDDVIPQAVTDYIGWVAGPLATTGLVVVLVIFMLFKREDLRNRIVTLSGKTHLAVTTKALDEAGQRIARYLLMQFIINVTYGLAVAIGLFLIGVDYAVLWGFAAAVLRYIPYVGPWVAASLPVAYSLLVNFGWQPVWVIGLIVVLELLSNNVMEPVLYGRGVGVSEIAVILAAIVWGWLWGPIGLVLATPMTACLVVAGRYVPALSFFNRLLGDAPEVEPHVVYYQRLLARDEDEAEEVFCARVDEAGPEQACDEVLVPTLESAKRDRMRGLIEHDQETYILESIGEHLDDMRPPAAAADTPALAGELPLVFGYAIRDAEDEAGLRILAKLLEGAPCRFEPVSRTVLLSELLSNLAERRPAGLCLVGLPPGGVTHARGLMKRLLAGRPDLTVAVGRWGPPLSERHRAAFQELGATYVGRTPGETAQHVISMARLKPTASADPVAATARSA